MDRIDALVIGAGVVGLAIGRALAATGRETVVVECADGIGQGVSSRNSEVIHSGLYYAPGSAKAALCTRGRALLYEFCQSHGVAHSACGKLVVATHADQHPALQGLHARAASNGVPLEWFSAAQAHEMEPALHCTAALWSPTTGIVDSHGLMLALQGDFERQGGAVALKSTVTAARFSPAGPALVQVDSADGDFELHADWVVNAAGLQACALARRFAGLDPAHVPPARFAKGSYFSLTGAAPFSRLIYPAPVDAWLGVHVTLDLAGQVRFGPDLEWLDATDPADIDYRVDPARAVGFEQSIRRFWP